METPSTKPKVKIFNVLLYVINFNRKKWQGLPVRNDCHPANQVQTYQMRFVCTCVCIYNSLVGLH